MSKRKQYTIRSQAKPKEPEVKTSKTTKEAGQQPESVQAEPAQSQPSSVGIKPEPIPSAKESPFLKPKKIREYTTQFSGKKPDPAQLQSPNETLPRDRKAKKQKIVIDEEQPETPPGETTAEQPRQPEEPGTSPEPSEETAEEQKIEPEIDEPPSSDRMTFPPGHSKRTVEDGIRMLNYILKNYGRFITDIPITKRIRFFDKISDQPKKIADILKIRNEKTSDRLPLDDEDKELITPPAERYLQDIGLELTPAQAFWAAVAMIIGKKLGIIIEIKKDNKDMISEINKTVDAAIEKWDAQNTSKKDNNITDVEIEE